MDISPGAFGERNGLAGLAEVEGGDGAGAALDDAEEVAVDSDLALGDDGTLDGNGVRLLGGLQRLGVVDEEAVAGGDDEPSLVDGVAIVVVVVADVGDGAVQERERLSGRGGAEVDEA